MNLQLSIPKPCKVEKSHFYPSGKGYYCDLCQKEVQNFTYYSERELIEHFHQNPAECGIFRSDQLNRELKGQTTNEFSLAGLLLSGFLLSTELCLAQNSDSIQIEIPDTTFVASDTTQLDSTIAEIDSITPKVKIELVLEEINFVELSWECISGFTYIEPEKQPRFLKLDSNSSNSSTKIPPSERKIEVASPNRNIPNSNFPNRIPFWDWLKSMLLPSRDEV